MAAQKSENGKRRDIIIQAAAKQFAKHGYDATTVRGIASLTGILPGSLYYYFRSKEELFAAVHEEAINHICTSVLHSVNPNDQPWDQLEQASHAYLKAMLLNTMYVNLIITEFPRRRTGKLREKLISDRERFERIFMDIIDKLPLAKDVNRSYWRLGLLGMLAWTIVWYKPSGDPPTVVAKSLINLLRYKTST